MGAPLLFNLVNIFRANKLTITSGDVTNMTVIYNFSCKKIKYLL